MPPISCACRQFPPVVIQHAARLDLRFTLSHRDVEDLLAERGLAVSHETVRRWAALGAEVRAGHRPAPGWEFHARRRGAAVGARCGRAATPAVAGRQGACETGAAGVSA